MDRLKHGTIVNIEMLACDKPLGLCQDVGVGIVLRGKVSEVYGNAVYQVAIVSGSFDGHRNDLGELWVNDFEVKVKEQDR